MMMVTEYLKMKCQSCGYEEWAEADIVAELATYQQDTKTYEILLECPECNGIMKWHQKKKKFERCISDFDIDDLPF